MLMNDLFPSIEHSIGETSHRPDHLTNKLNQKPTQGGARPKSNKTKIKEKTRPQSAADLHSERPALKR
jgi:hypothetical protein